MAYRHTLASLTSLSFLLCSPCWGNDDDDLTPSSGVLTRPQQVQAQPHNSDASAGNPLYALASDGSERGRGVRREEAMSTCSSDVGHGSSEAGYAVPLLQQGDTGGDQEELFQQLRPYFPKAFNHPPEVNTPEPWTWSETLLWIFTGSMSKKRKDEALIEQLSRERNTFLNNVKTGQLSPEILTALLKHPMVQEVIALAQKDMLGHAVEKMSSGEALTEGWIHIDPQPDNETTGIPVGTTTATTTTTTTATAELADASGAGEEVVSASPTPPTTDSTELERRAPVFWPPSSYSVEAHDDYTYTYLTEPSGNTLALGDDIDTVIAQNRDEELKKRIQHHATLGEHLSAWETSLLEEYQNNARRFKYKPVPVLWIEHYFEQGMLPLLWDTETFEYFTEYGEGLPLSVEGMTLVVSPELHTILLSLKEPLKISEESSTADFTEVHTLNCESLLGYQESATSIHNWAPSAREDLISWLREVKNPQRESMRQWLNTPANHQVIDELWSVEKWWVASFLQRKISVLEWLKTEDGVRAFFWLQKIRKEGHSFKMRVEDEVVDVVMDWERYQALFQLPGLEPSIVVQEGDGSTSPADE